MSLDPTNLLLSAQNSSNKVLLQGSGSITVPGVTGGETHAVVTIPHHYASDNLLFQVSSNGGPTNGVMLPWQANDGRFLQYAYVDSVNLYIVFNSSDTGGSGNPAYAVTYYYRILIP